MQQRMIRIEGLPPYPLEVHDDRDQFISSSIAHWGTWDIPGTAVIRSLLQADADFVDAGANIGWYTVLAGHLLRGRGAVHAFEPDPDNLERLAANIAGNGLTNVTLNACALADRAGTEQLFLSSDNLGDHRLSMPAADRPSVPVRVETLDGYGALDPVRPLVIKLDVQGSEVRVLQGARDLLADATRDVVILCEVWPAALAANGSSATELIALFAEAGFLAAVVDRQRPKIRFTPVRDLLATEATHAGDWAHAIDILCFRRIGGLMRPLLGGAA